MGVTDEGIDHILNVEFDSATRVDRWYIGLIYGGGTPVLRDADTQALHPGWSANISFTDAGTNYPWFPVAGAGEYGNEEPVRVVSNFPTPLYGIRLTSQRYVAGLEGVLFATLAFDGGVRTLDSGDTLDVYLTIAGTGS